MCTFLQNMGQQIREHIRGTSISDRPLGSQSNFEPIRNTFNNAGLIGIISQSVLRGGGGYCAAMAVPALNSAFAGGLAIGNFSSRVIGFFVNEGLIGDNDDPWGIAAITKMALTVLQGFVCSYVFSMSITTFATYYLVAEITNAVLTATIGVLQNTIDPLFLS